MNAEIKKATKELRKFAFAFPGAYEDNPWDEVVAKAGKKVFVFFGHDDELAFSVKLPRSCDDALRHPFTSPTGYGLGKSGWVSVHYTKARPPVALFKEWIEESYRAVAPKKLISQLDEAP